MASPGPNVPRRRSVYPVVAVVIVIIVGALLFFGWRAVSKPTVGIEKTPQMNALLKEWKATPQGQQGTKRMQERIAGLRAGRDARGPKRTNK